MKLSDFVGTFTDENGVTITITTNETAERFGDVELDKVFRIVKRYGGGLVSIDARNPEGVDAPGLIVVTSEEDTATIREGEYLAIYHDGDDFLECPLFSRDDGIVTDGSAKVFPVSISNENDDILAYGIEVGGEVVTAGLVMAGQLITGAAHKAYKRKTVLLEHLSRVTSGIVEKVDYPLDKVNTKVWKLLEGAPDGQLGIGYDIDTPGGEINIDMANSNHRKKGVEVPVSYSIDFSRLDEVRINKKLEPYDKRVYIALASLFHAGYEVVSLQQIYSQMGYRGEAGQKGRDMVNDAITKLSKAWVTIDNIQETKFYDYDRFRFDGALLPMERVQAYVNGQLVESAIYMLKEPPLITFARDRGQITTIELKLLGSPLSKTSANIQLEDYLIEQIAHIKKKGGKRSNRLLLETIYRNTGIKAAYQRTRALPKIKKLLAHYEKCGFIRGYKLTQDAIEIFY